MSKPEKKGEPGMKKVRLATTWLDGCSGCHMSLLDIDERIIELVEKVDIVYSPIIDVHEFPENVDVALVEGAVSSDEDEEKARKIRERTKILISFGDCAVTANVPSMRNYFRLDDLYNRAYIENAALNQQVPSTRVPLLLKKTRPLHEVVKVDIFLPGCPPRPDIIHFMLTELLEGRMPDLTGMTRFGI